MPRRQPVRAPSPFSGSHGEYSPQAWHMKHREQKRPSRPKPTTLLQPAHGSLRARRTRPSQHGVRRRGPPAVVDVGRLQVGAEDDLLSRRLGGCAQHSSSREPPR